MGRLNHLTLFVQDRVRAADWYVGMLGLEVEFELPESGTTAVRDPSDFTIFLTERADRGSEPRCVLYFQVDDVDAEYDGLKSQAVVVAPRVEPWVMDPSLWILTAIRSACGITGASPSRDISWRPSEGVTVTDGGSTAGRRPVVLGPGEGRAYPMGRISAVFKADGAETGHAYSISEWWLDPHTKGPGAHSHPEDNVIYVLAGTMSVLVGTEWIEAGTGSFVLVPGNVTHDFENRGSERAGMLSVSAPGNFEQQMPGIAQWFAEHPPGDTRV